MTSAPLTFRAPVPVLLIVTDWVAEAVSNGVVKLSEVGDKVAIGSVLVSFETEGDAVSAEAAEPGVEPDTLFSIFPSRLTAAARKFVPPKSTPIA